MGATSTTLDAILKNLYPPNAFLQMVEEDHPFLGLVKKTTNFTGRKMIVPLQTARNQAISSTYATAIGASSANAYKAFEVTRDSHFGFVKVDDEYIRAAKRGDGSFIDALDEEVKATMLALTDDLDFAIWGDGTGARGTIASSGVSGNVITLDDARDALNFKLGMSIKGYTSGGTAHSAATVTVVNQSTGKITVDSIGTIIAGDLLYREGDKDDPGLQGIAAWCPTSAPSSTSFFGVDRTSSELLYGIIVDSSSPTAIADKITNTIKKARQYAVPKPTHVFLHPDRWQELADDLGAISRGDDRVKSRDGAFGYSALYLNTVAGRIPILNANRCGYNEARILHMPSWELASLDGNAPMVLADTDGKVIRRSASTNTQEMLAGWYAQLICRNPGANIVGNLA